MRRVRSMRAGVPYDIQVALDHIHHKKVAKGRVDGFQGWMYNSTPSP